MNYAVVILVFVLLVALIYWFIHGRHYYTGPRSHAHVEHGVIIEDETDTPAEDQEKGPGPVVA